MKTRDLGELRTIHKKTAKFTAKELSIDDCSMIRQELSALLRLANAEVEAMANSKNEAKLEALGDRLYILNTLMGDVDYALYKKRRSHCWSLNQKVLNNGGVYTYGGGSAFKLTTRYHPPLSGVSL